MADKGEQKTKYFSNLYSQECGDESSDEEENERNRYCEFSCQNSDKCLLETIKSEKIPVLENNESSYSSESRINYSDAELMNSSKVTTFSEKDMSDFESLLSGDDSKPQLTSSQFEVFKKPELETPSYFDNNNLQTNVSYSTPVFNITVDETKAKQINIPNTILKTDNNIENIELLKLNEKNLQTKRKAAELIKSKISEDDLRNFFEEWAETDLSFAETMTTKFEQYKSLKKKKSFTTTGGERNWNQEFQQLVEQNVGDFGNTELCKQIYLLVGDFSHASSLYAQIIISELCLTYEQKTIKPVEVGGVAGGSKYIVGGILFKFAVDQKVSDSPTIYMYGGDKPRDDLAMKAASRELQSICTLFATSPKILHFPLVAIVDYLGYRVIASSLLPIGSTTIKYGSNDGGATVKYEIEELNNAMAAAFDIWNLAPHEVGREGYPIAGPGDIEGHLGHDGRYYVIDCARMMPPEAPPIDKTERMKDPRGVFYKLLRHELLNESVEKFSSDCFTGWSRYDKKRVENEQKVRKLTEYLHNRIIPDFAKSFECHNFSKSASYQSNPNPNNLYVGSHRTDLNSYSSVELFRIIDRVDISFMMHFVGINMRYIGRVRSFVRSPIHRQLLLSHCAARAIKNDIRAKLRNEMKNLYGSPSDIPFRELLIQQFNLIIGNSIASDQYWAIIKNNIIQSFSNSLSVEEMDPSYDIRNSLEMRAVVYILQKLTSISISPRAFTSMSKNIKSFVMVSSDIISTSPSVREMHISSMSSAVLLKRNSNTLDDVEAKYRLLLAAKSDIEKALRIVPKCPKIAKLYAQILMDLFAIDKDEENREVYLNTIITQLVYALNFIPSTTYSVSLDAIKLIDNFPKKNKLYGTQEFIKKLREVKKSFSLTVERDDAISSNCATQYLDYLKMKQNYINLLNISPAGNTAETTPTTTGDLVKVTENNNNSTSANITPSIPINSGEYVVEEPSYVI